MEVCKACGSNNPPAANFCCVCGAALHNRRDMERASGKFIGTSGERRPLTIMFCDLVGSTELSSRLDPEELEALIRDYQKRTAELVRKFGEFIAQFLGDGIVAYFGWPAAVKRMRKGLYAAVWLHRRQYRLSAKRTNHCEYGSALPPASWWFGEPIGTGQSFQQPATGVTPNLAARLQSLAKRGTVVIDAADRPSATRRQIPRSAALPALEAGGASTSGGIHISLAMEY